MEELYILNSRFDKKDTCRGFVGLEDNGLHYVRVEQVNLNKRIHRFLKKSFKFCDVTKNENFKDALFARGAIYSEGNSNKNDYELIKVLNHPGGYFPRIYRPYLEPEGSLLCDGQRIEQLEKIVLNYPDYNPYDTNLIVSGLNQLAILSDMLIETLNTVYPSQKNLKTYGHDIKNLLVLSCIEVEAQLKGIYKANEASTKRSYTTKDYIKLKDVMQLGRYSVRLPLYPDLKKTYTPFKTWSETVGATKSIKWYDNYNAVKHNSETEFPKATLESAIQAICAVAVLLQAQYGPDIPYWREEIGSYFEISNDAKWSIKDRILPPMCGENWQIIKIGL